MNKLIIEFQPNNMLACNPPKWNIYYKDKTQTYKFTLDYYELKLFI